MDDLHQYLVEEELDSYRDGWISRREFLKRATLFGATASVAAAMASAVVPVPRVHAAPAAQRSPFSVPADDPAVVTDWVSYPSNDGVLISGYLAWPAGSGVGPPTRELSARNAWTAAYRSLDSTQNALDFAAGVEFLMANPTVDGSKLAATGYCLGGSIIWRLTTLSPYVRAAAPFYGSDPPLADVPNIRAAVLGVYAGLDDRVNASIPRLEPALQAAGVTYRINIYPGADHGFHADTDSDYHPQAATQAWMDTLNWFAQYLDLPAPTF
ncbi:MAG: Carboxymethylenebutenolidase [Chloroflexi bacterium]|nr:Carboxymethylenebutenolidase [Chloroflexota bacterium]